MVETYDQPQGSHSRWYWLDLLAGPLTWTVQFLLLYMLAEGICMAGRISEPLIPGSTLRLIGVGVTLAGVGVLAWRVLDDYRRWRGLKSTGNGQGSEPVGVFLALAGFILNTFFLAVVLLTGVSLLFVSTCGGALV